ncbi:MAG TPA: hypothetical protein VN368_00890 [Candidatus Methylomirabilis sp.]|nr:hypothetical protein [Candidatus Methylomirabilis sp.]
MKKSYIKCPYCQDEVSVSGSSMHVRNKHGDKYEEFKNNFAEIKKSAVIKESTTRTEVRGPEPPKIEEKKIEAQEVVKQPETAAAEKKKEGDEKPAKGDSFLSSFNKWLDSPEF